MWCVEVRKRIPLYLHAAFKSNDHPENCLCQMTPGRRHHNYVRSEKRKEIFIPCRLFTVPSIQHWNSMKSAIHRLDRMVITPQHTAHYTTPRQTKAHTAPHYTTPHHTKVHHTTLHHDTHQTKPHHTKLHTTPHHTTLHERTCQNNSS